MIKLTRRKRVVKRPKFADERWTGPEPEDNVVIESSDSSEYIKALSWYNYYYEADKAREWIIDYMEASGYSAAKVKTVRNLPSWKIVPTAGWVAHLLLDKCWTLPESSLNYLNKRIEEMSKEEVKVETPTESKPTVNPRERVEAKARALVGLVDEELDKLFLNDDHTFSCYDFLKTQNASPVACNKIIEYAENIINDLNTDLEEATRGKAKRIKKWIVFFQAILSDCDRFLGNKKTTRKPRKVKQKSVQELVGKVKYLKESPAMKLVSIDPTEIIKAKTLWTYNTKYKQLSIYNAVDVQGLSVKGTTIINFKPETSVIKRLRKPELVLEQLLKAGKVEARTFMDNIKTTALPAKGRLNEDTILLKVVK